MASTLMTEQELQRRAVERAMIRGGSAAVCEGRYPDVYLVQSNTRELHHTVSLDSGTYRCDCEAGMAHRPCWHAGAVYLYRLEVVGTRVTRAAAPPPAPARTPRKEVALT